MALSEIHVVDVKSIPLAVVRRQVRAGELSTVIPRDCGVVWEFARANKLQAGRNVAFYRDGSISLEVGVEMMDSFAPSADVVSSATPSGRAVTVAHFGPYQRLGVAHQAVLDWCAANNLERAGPSWDIYGHWKNEWNADPSQIRTDIFYQLI